MLTAGSERKERGEGVEKLKREREDGGKEMTGGADGFSVEKSYKKLQKCQSKEKCLRPSQ